MAAAMAMKLGTASLAVPVRPVTAAVAPTTPNSPNPAMASAGRRRPMKPTRSANTAMAEKMPNSRACLSFVPNVRIAKSLRGTGTRSMALSPTDRIGEVNLSNTPTNNSATARPNAPASKPLSGHAARRSGIAT